MHVCLFLYKYNQSFKIIYDYLEEKKCSWENNDKTVNKIISIDAKIGRKKTKPKVNIPFINEDRYRFLNKFSYLIE